MGRQRKPQQEAELDVTSFMNLMIVLVPVLLMNMVFSQLAVLDLHLPLGNNAAQAPITSEDVTLAVVIRAQGFEITRTYQQSTESIVTLPKKAGGYDYEALSKSLQDIKKNAIFADKKAINLLSEPKIDYQTLITVMDSVRAYPTVIAASLVDATLFPDISLGEAPEVTP